ncbi:Methyltranfer-dom domain-containing protein [Mycena chlorophos]|uniref:Methyltranfer-dom domain-containing protein n=1 Tax=Mycena chlorophos TaxID=658473 RepID=A0A8H6VRP9_MYCCL|nr:Methyltranfer-dom domain-containing protein [Mycena chlorophos]
MPPSNWSRNPRNLALAGGLLLAICLYMFWPSSDSLNTPQEFVTEEEDLQTRVARSEQRYNKALLERKELIKKWGPTAKDISLQAPFNSYAETALTLFPGCPRNLGKRTPSGTFSRLRSTARTKSPALESLATEESGFACVSHHRRRHRRCAEDIQGLSRVETKPDCVVYSFGINYESSFEADLLASTDHCQIWGYDFSVKSFGPEIPKSQLHRAHFHALGLAGTDKHGPEDDPKMYTLESLMQINGHNHIDILKIDIERWEIETLAAIVKPYIASGQPLPFAQLQLEIHLWGISFEETLAWWEALETAGLRPFWTEPNLVFVNFNRLAGPELAEYSFINVKGENAFISDAKPRYHREYNRHFAGPTLA